MRPPFWNPNRGRMTGVLQTPLVYVRWTDACHRSVQALSAHPAGNAENLTDRAFSMLTDMKASAKATEHQRPNRIAIDSCQVKDRWRAGDDEAVENPQFDHATGRLSVQPLES